MEKQLTQLLKNNYTPEDVRRQIRLTTADITTRNQNLSESNSSPSESSQTTPDIIEKLPKVIITLAILLTKEEVRRLGQWFRRNVDPQILLEIRQDHKIIGGCQIIWQGFEGDFSLRRKFEKAKRNEN